MAILQRLPVDEAQLGQYCKRWKIAKLELFGSAVLDFAAARDVDLLVSFFPDAEWSLLDHAQMEQELSELLGRQVDLVSRRAIESSQNALRRSAILGSAIRVYG
jgi:predicted nucleotidyltransferase